MAEVANDVRSVLIPTARDRLLLPNAVVAEVLTYQQPEAPDGTTAPWLIGYLNWRGWQVPVISWALLTGRGTSDQPAEPKIGVLKALGANPTLPFIAMLLNGLPQLVRVGEANLQPLEQDRTMLPPGAHSTVDLNGIEAYIPDMDAIERRLADIGEA